MNSIQITISYFKPIILMRRREEYSGGGEGHYIYFREATTF
jgi:hypothetical protein